jgi:hypothetical protein
MTLPSGSTGRNNMTENCVGYSMEHTGEGNMKKAFFSVLMILVFTLTACVQRPGAIAAPTPVTQAPELTQTSVPTPSQMSTWVPLPTIALTPGAAHASLPTFALPNFPTPLTPLPTLDLSTLPTPLPTLGLGTPEPECFVTASKGGIQLELGPFISRYKLPRAGNILYKTGIATNGVEIVDVSDLDNPFVVKTIPLDGLIVSALSASEGRLLVFSQNAQTPEERQFQIFEINNPLEPIEVGQFRPAFEIVSFTVAGDMIYAAAPEGEQYLLYLLDIADPARPVEAGRFALPKAAGGLITSGDLLYMMMTDMSSNEIWALNIGDRSHPYLAGHHPLTYLTGWHYPLSTGDFAIDGDQIYLAAGNAGFYILQAVR